MSTNSKPQIVTDDHALAARINRIGQMPPRELREAYRHAFGRETTSGNRAWLVRTISNRLREIEESHQQPQALAMARVVAKDLGCEEALARYLQTLPPVAPCRECLRRPLTLCPQKVPATHGSRRPAPCLSGTSVIATTA
ncbi:MAG: hypothetical protein RLZZ116_352 [Planctomycetota bacterium]|jgi:hypothetical protein